ncbi:hypothetical protein TNCV_1350541 [Trichonephila clavipes]|nr:hypothetical protein TNCV_1350541 [Trichonephila clavipes]
MVINNRHKRKGLLVTPNNSSMPSLNSRFNDLMVIDPSRSVEDRSYLHLRYVADVSLDDRSMEGNGYEQVTPFQNFLNNSFR